MIQSEETQHRTSGIPCAVKRPRVLICDDDERYLELLGVMLDAEGFEVVPTTDARAVQLLAQEHHPDVIVTDVSMPDMDGFDLAYGLRGDPLTSGIPLIFFTARAGDLDRLQAQNAGATEYLLKPLAITEIIRRIRDILAHHTQGKIK